MGFSYSTEYPSITSVLPMLVLTRHHNNILLYCLIKIIVRKYSKQEFKYSERRVFQPQLKYLYTLQ